MPSCWVHLEPVAVDQASNASSTSTCTFLSTCTCPAGLGLVASPDAGAVCAYDRKQHARAGPGLKNAFDLCLMIITLQLYSCTVSSVVAYLPRSALRLHRYLRPAQPSPPPPAPRWQHTPSQRTTLQACPTALVHHQRPPPPARYRLQMGAETLPQCCVRRRVRRAATTSPAYKQQPQQLATKTKIYRCTVKMVAIWLRARQEPIIG